MQTNTSDKPKTLTTETWTSQFMQVLTLAIIVFLFSYIPRLIALIPHLGPFLAPILSIFMLFYIGKGVGWIELNFLQSAILGMFSAVVFFYQLLRIHPEFAGAGLGWCFFFLALLYFGVRDGLESARQENERDED
jgi:hypothetical protein